jgi:hypothetical protein
MFKEELPKIIEINLGKISGKYFEYVLPDYYDQNKGDSVEISIYRLKKSFMNFEG